MKLEAILTGVSKLGIDTAPVIYFVEAHPHYDALVIEVFQSIADNKLVAVTSVITMTEVLIQPLRENQLDLEQQYRDLLTRSANFEMIFIDDVIAERAADLRARYNLRTPDALQLATALIAGCEAFLTNDLALKRVTEMQIIVLEELVSATNG
jgi:predicted nucleic acid-binding protein